MKYLKKFHTNADYQTFKEGDDWVTPNVSTIEEDNGIFYNEILKLISFTLSDGFGEEAIRYALPNTTWADWVNTEYNENGTFYVTVNNLSVSMPNTNNPFSTRLFKGGEAAGMAGDDCLSTDVILDGHYYYQASEPF